MYSPCPPTPHLRFPYGTALNVYIWQYIWWNKRFGFPLDYKYISNVCIFLNFFYFVPVSLKKPYFRYWPISFYSGLKNVYSVFSKLLLATHCSSSSSVLTHEKIFNLDWFDSNPSHGNPIAYKIKFRLFFKIAESRNLKPRSDKLTRCLCHCSG